MAVSENLFYISEAYVLICPVEKKFIFIQKYPLSCGKNG